MAILTLQYPAHTSKTGYASLRKTLLTTASLYNLIIQQRNYATSSHRHRYSRTITARDITDLASYEPEFQEPARRLLSEVEKQAHRAFSAYFDARQKRKQNLPTLNTGRPKTKDPHLRRTVGITESHVQHLTIPQSRTPPTQPL